MPFRVGRDEHRRPLPAPDLGIGFCERLFQHGGFDGLALAVEFVELGGDHFRLRRLVERQQPGAKRRVADAAAGIDARADQEAEMIGRQRRIDPREAPERGDAAIGAAPERDQALDDEGAVEADERHDIADRAERHEIEPLQEIRLFPLAGIPAAPAQFAIDRDDREEGDPDGGEIAEAGEVVLAVGVDDGDGRRQLGAHLVMVEHHRGMAERGSDAERLDARRAAIDGDDQRGALVHQRADGVGIGTVALEDAVGDIDARRQPLGGQEAGEQGRGRGAVDIVIAEDRDLLAALDRIGDARRGGVHVGERRRVRHQPAEARLEELRRCIDTDAARRENAGEQFRQLMPLHHGGSGEAGGGIEPVVPAAAGHRPVDAEEAAPSGRTEFRHQGIDQLSAANFSSSRWVALMKRMVPLDERITSVSVVMRPSRAKRTPFSMLPSVTPVAANRTSPRTIS